MSRCAAARLLAAGAALLLVYPVPLSAQRSSVPLTARGRANLEAFTRLLGYVRFFHPTEAGRTTNWDDFAVQGVRTVEGAPTSDSLARVLRVLFEPVAPAVMIARTGNPVATGARGATGAGAGSNGRPATSADGIAYWRHLGVQLTPDDTASSYQSRLVITPADRADSLRPDPATPLVVALPGGVTAHIPLALRVPLPADSAARELGPIRPAATALATAEDRATRLAAVALLWGVMQHFYPYFDVVHVDWGAELPRALTRAATDSVPALFEHTLGAMVVALHDGHGFVRSDARPLLGSPAILLEHVEGQLVVTHVVDSTATPVRRGDVVVEIGGRSAAAVFQDHVALYSSATPQWAEYQAIRWLTVGPRDSVWRGRVRRADGTESSVALPRTISNPRLQHAQEPRPGPIAELAPGVMYVDLTRLDDTTFQAAVPRLAAATGLVFDMRGYPGTISTPDVLAHLTDRAMRSAPFEIPLVTRPDRVGWQFVDVGWPVLPAAPRFRARVAFLTDARVISYGETTMGIVEAYHLGAIVGAPTAGTNGSINPFALPGGYRIWWSGMRVRKHDGSTLHGVGIRPTVPAARTLAGIRAGRDEVLEVGLRVVMK
ncbi:MAG TPA: S41 family peptidase [Gemmatimonadales bacterium]|nr:S41 family peptidase [Gemmatimonadales bacterium]